MTLFDPAKNEAANAIVINEVTLHNGDPGDGTANALAIPAKPISFGAAVSGVRTQAADVLFDIPAGSTVSHYTLWGGGVAKKKGAFATAKNYPDAGDQHKVKSGTITITG